MMNKSNEQILIRALELYEGGKKPTEIFAMFPEARQEIKELFEVMEALGKTKASIRPEPRLLQEILTKTQSREEQLLKIHRRRFHLWQLAVPVGALAILILIFASSLTTAPGVSQFAENPFDLGAIKKEAAAADFNQELYTFLEQEEELQEVDAALANF